MRRQWLSGRLTRHQSPAHWPARRALALTRDAPGGAGLGACGPPHAPPGRGGAPHQAAIVRDPAHPARWWLAEDAPRALLAAVPVGRIIRVVLTTAHLCQDSRCADLTHLRMMCQRCHLAYDTEQHAAHAAMRPGAARSRGRRTEAGSGRSSRPPHGGGRPRRLGRGGTGERGRQGERPPQPRAADRRGGRGTGSGGAPGGDRQGGAARA